MGKGGAGSDSRSRHEAPWGARMAYAGGALSAVTASGPGMKVMNKKEMDAKRAKPSSAAVLQERAALEGLSTAEYRKRHPSAMSAEGDMSRGYESGGQSAAPAASASTHRMWYYLDKSGEEQGPYPLRTMRAWVGSGQLPPETKVKRGKDGILREASRSSAMTAAEKPRGRGQRSAFELYVGNIGSLSEDDLTDAFAEHGPVSRVWIPLDHGENPKPRGFAFVGFETAEAMEKSLASAEGGMRVADRTLRVARAKGQTQRADAPAAADAPAGAPAAGLGQALLQGQGEERGAKRKRDQLYAGDADPHGHWAQMTDAASGKPYWWNALSDEKCWSLPGRTFAAVAPAARPSAAASGADEGAGGAGALEALGGYSSSDSE